MPRTRFANDRAKAFVGGISMPFVTEAGEPLDRVPLLYRMVRDFQLTAGFSWRF